MNKEKQIRVLETKGRYEIRDGRLYCKYRGVWIEKVASTPQGYRQHVLFNGRGWGKVIVYEHIIVWLYANGVYEGDIDHINHDRSDNRIENLRVVTHSENMLHSPVVNKTTSRMMHPTVEQMITLLDCFANGISKAESARRAGLQRVTALHHINKFINTGRCSFIDKVNEDFFRKILGINQPKIVKYPWK